METLQLSQARGFFTGGTVHVDHQQPGRLHDLRAHATRARRSTARDVAKMLEAPIFHVNGDDPEAVVFVTRLALDYRMKFHKDVVIDLVVLPPPRPQRGRRAGGDAAGHVPDDPRAPDRAAAVRGPADRRRRAHRGRGAGAWSSSTAAASMRASRRRAPRSG